MLLPIHLKVTISVWISRLIVVITNLFAIKFILPYLGVESYAVYLILLSFTSWCGLVDFGIGFTLQNHISKLKVKKQDYQPYIDSAFKIIFCFTIIAFIMILLLYNSIQNFVLTKYLFILNNQNNSLNIVLFSLILLTIFGIVNISSKIYYALEKGTIPNILIAVSYILSFLIMLATVNMQSESNRILKIILCYTVPQMILLGFLFFKVFRNSLKNMFKIDKDILKVLFNKSIKFGGISAMVLLVVEIDYIIMAKTVIPSEIAIYNIFVKIFFVFYQGVFLGMLNALWPKSTELYYEKDYERLKRIVKRSLMFGITLMILIILLSFLLKNIILKLFLPSLIYDLSYTFFLSFIIFFIIKVIVDTYSIFLQSFNKLNVFYIYMPIQIMIGICLQYILSLKYGMYGIIWGGIISSLFTCFWLLPYVFYKTINKAISIR